MHSRSESNSSSDSINARDSSKSIKFTSSSTESTDSNGNINFEAEYKVKDPSLVSNLFDNLAAEFCAFAKQDTYELRRDKVITERGIGYLSCIFTPHDEACTKYDLYQLIWNGVQIALEDSEKEFKKEATGIIKQQQSISTTTKTTTTATKCVIRRKTIEEICEQLINVVFKIVINFYGLRMNSILLPGARKNMDNFTRLFIGQFNSDHEYLSTTPKTTSKTTATSKNTKARDTFLSNLEILCRGDKMVPFIVTAMTLGLVKRFGDSFIKTNNYANDNPYDLNGGALHQTPTIKHFLNKNICCSFAMFVIFSQIGIALYLSRVIDLMEISSDRKQKETKRADMEDDIVLKYLFKYSNCLSFIYKYLRFNNKSYRRTKTAIAEKRTTLTDDTKSDFATTSLYILPDVIVHHRLGTLLMACANYGYQYTCFRLVYDFYCDEQRKYLVVRSDGTAFKSAMDIASGDAEQFFQQKIISPTRGSAFADEAYETANKYLDLKMEMKYFIQCMPFETKSKHFEYDESKHGFSSDYDYSLNAKFDIGHSVDGYSIEKKAASAYFDTLRKGMNILLDKRLPFGDGKFVELCVYYQEFNKLDQFCELNMKAAKSTVDGMKSKLEMDKNWSKRIMYNSLIKHTSLTPIVKSGHLAARMNDQSYKLLLRHGL